MYFNIDSILRRIRTRPQDVSQADVIRLVNHLYDRVVALEAQVEELSAPTPAPKTKKKADDA